MLYDFESVFTPFWFQEKDSIFDENSFRSWTDSELNYREKFIVQHLEELRRHEPSSKRKQHSEYRIWVDINADYLYELHYIRDEMARRK